MAPVSNLNAIGKLYVHVNINLFSLKTANTQPQVLHKCTTPSVVFREGQYETKCVLITPKVFKFSCTYINCKCVTAP